MNPLPNDTSLVLIGATKGGYLQFSGMTVTYDPSAASGQKVISIKVGDAEVDKDATYRIVTVDFLATGGDGYDCLKDYPAQMNDTLDSIFAEHMKRTGTITESTITGGRLVAV